MSAPGRYQSDPVAFWLTPNLYFLILYFFIAGGFLLSKRYAFVISMLFSLSCAYVANFITIDGYRIMAVILIAPITYVLREMLSINADRIEKIFLILHSAFAKILNFILLKWAEMISAIVLVFCWIYILKSASVRGLLLNQHSLSSPVLGDIEPLFIVLALGSLSNIAVIIFDRLRFSALIIISQLVLLLPLGLITLQFFRQVYFYNQPLGITGKVVAIIYLLFLAICSIRFKIILPISFKAAVQLRRLFIGRQ